MEDEEGIPCPFCGDTIDCEHLIAAFDSGEICGGVLFESEDKVLSLVVEAMNKHKKDLPEKIHNDKYHSLREYWENWNKETDSSAEEFAQECYELKDFISNTLKDMDLSGELDEFGWIFWAEDSRKAKNDFFKKIQEDLN